MSIETNAATPDDCVVDLGPLAAACRELVHWYDEFLAGNHPEIADLDRVVTTLQLLPPVPGRIGRDIQLIIGGGRNSTRNDIIGAVERLRTISNHAPPAHESGAAPNHRGAQRRTRGTKRADSSVQAPLPGFDHDR